ncbi:MULTISPECIES: SDR family NAD(P)-dependent oxidoreductase [unclassified Mycobacterium]|uniref:SDR family NAD(P)-dependent oxidoreductase n=1 Tax=unclassified Mycobacterium TaxID=2642494 RepID=UPI00073FEB3E|nr:MULTISPECIES: SDR family NAD(P)-dependent oxidoreductase [unclassified Mycobacterium]KUH85505.1 hypothetical protein AU186_22350 [Mycobacterium sp. GA-1999]KUH91363.1 hypothetical protein AU185_09415 [Mycobacterium sp. GA-0227b]KUH96382.1 hypothetical protein AU187_14430 [Mycobacterium sp. IS-1556]
MKRLDGHRVLVTGAASGIGPATVLRLLDEGAAVVAADVSADGLEKTSAQAQEFGSGTQLFVLESNIGDGSSVVDGVRSTVDTEIRIDGGTHA